MMCGRAWVVAVAIVLSGCGGGKGIIDPEPSVEDSAPSWSPDGHSVAYVHFNPDRSDTAAPSGLYRIPAAGGTPTLKDGSGYRQLTH